MQEEEAWLPQSCSHRQLRHLAEVIKSLAGLHQEHHEMLLKMRDDQKCWFHALVQAQQEDRELFRSWMDQEGQAEGPSPRSIGTPAHVALNKTTG
ncbi:Tripeptidyl-peptidase sed1 [Labeo rohita]|uniref:Tripeptidyl-peptidase sed1 n=1 Tax=Labeo rohita TaxID=84645 RepID=A0ABQ8KYS7_LABRO|nr:Tripeptidyl-peptidase sed1 [Labeo rohita]